jgi:3-hydroxyacyl-CoA dehydrogenase
MSLTVDQHLQRCAVLGAAGKMGRGIAQLVLEAMSLSEATQHHEAGSGRYQLTLVDIDMAALRQLKQQLRTHLSKYAEKIIIALRNHFAGNQSLISNREIIEYYVNGAMDNVQLSTAVEAASDALVIFEAVAENLELKSRLFRRLASGGQSPYIFSNTSSIPIGLLNSTSDLQGHIIGFHFYNPPPVQKLLEIIPAQATVEPLRQLAAELAVRLQKQVVTSQDVAGFIGNGYLIRELLYSCNLVAELQEEHTFPGALYIVDQVTRHWLLRPMGIFQLIDYVGLDVADAIWQIMNRYLPGGLEPCTLLTALLAAKQIGGQHLDGSQREGFFRYLHGQPTAVFESTASRYIAIDEPAAAPWRHPYDHILGDHPAEPWNWKSLHRYPDRHLQIADYFKWLTETDTLGATLAKRYLQHTKATAQQLVTDQVAATLADVDTVLKSGFYHLYGAEEIDALF